MRSTAKKESEAPYISFVPSALISARNQALVVEGIAGLTSTIYVLSVFWCRRNHIFSCVIYNMDCAEQMNNGYIIYENKQYKVPPVSMDIIYCTTCSGNSFVNEETYNNRVEIAFSGVVYEDLLDQNNN
jgi:hypothetical protein